MADQPNTFLLTIASVGETRFDGAAISATLPGTAGEFTILARHEPIVTTLKKGTIIVKNASKEEKTFEIDGGVLECSGNKAVVLL
jgi:F-type H+-transporting ATPase subunit epsilon